jgi:hypothetical protein
MAQVLPNLRIPSSYGPVLATQVYYHPHDNKVGHEMRVPSITHTQIYNHVSLTCKVESIMLDLD